MLIKFNFQGEQQYEITVPYNCKRVVFDQQEVVGVPIPLIKEMEFYENNSYISYNGNYTSSDFNSGFTVQGT